MANSISNVSFAQPTDPALELADIARKRKLAEALQAQAAQPSGGTEMVGGWAIPKSPWEGVGKMAQALSGAYQNRQLDAREKSVAAESRAKDKREREQIIATFTNPGQPVVADPNAAQPPQWLANAQSSTMNDGTPAGAPSAPPPRPMNAGQRLAAELARSDNPAYAQMGMTSLMSALTKDKDESLFSKIDPQHYTPASVARFSQTHAYADLVPVRKKELATLGGTSRLYDPYADATGDMAHTVKPDTTATLAQAQQHWSGISPYQAQSLGIDRGRLANQGLETQFNTGAGVTGPVGAPPMPQVGAPVPAGAPAMPPQQPQPAAVAPPAAPMPSAAPAPAPRVAAPAMAAAPAGLPPKMAAEVEAAKRKDMNAMQNKRDFNMQGLGSTIDEARAVLTGKGDAGTTAPTPTSSGFGTIADSALSFVGISGSGAPQAAKLKAIGGALVSKMPRMEGPQSDKDVANYKEMAGQVADSTLPLKTRLEALAGVEKLWRQYEPTTGVPGAAPLGNITERRNAPRTGSSRIVVDY